MPHARRDGVRLYYEQEGQGDPSFVFVHGWCCNRTFFQPQFEHFKASHSVVTLDLRGCGESDQPDGGYDISTLAQDVGWLCGELGVNKPVIVGHSMGALVGIELAVQRPRLLAGVVAVDPGPLHPTPEVRSVFAGLIAQLEGPNGEEVRRVFVESMFLPTDDAERKRAIVEAMGSVPLPVAAAMMQGTLAWNAVAALALCDVPLLVLRSSGSPGGSNDPARLLSVNPRLQLGVTVGAGHFHQLEVPEQVTAMIERFVRVAMDSGARD